MTKFIRTTKRVFAYTAIQDDFTLEVSEWYFFSGDLIEEIVAYHNIEGEINEERKLSNF